jgi:hypothetical protein
LSSYAYGAITAKRQGEEANTSTQSSGKPGVGTYIDVLAALVPAEVLALNAALLPVMTTTSSDNADGKSMTTITEPGALKALFIVSIVLSAGLYVVGHSRQGKRANKVPTGLRILPMLIPAAAYVGWTMLQPATAFTAVAPDLSLAVRELIAATAAIVLGVIAASIGFKADKEDPPS